MHLWTPDRLKLHYKNDEKMQYMIRQMKEQLDIDGSDHLPCGQVIGAVNITDCFLMVDQNYLESLDPTKRLQLESRHKLMQTNEIGFAEFHYGDFSPGRFAWKLEQPRTIDIPASINGSLGLWDFDNEWEKQKQNQIKPVFTSNGKAIYV